MNGFIPGDAPWRVCLFGAFLCEAVGFGLTVTVAEACGKSAASPTLLTTTAVAILLVILGAALGDGRG